MSNFDFQGPSDIYIPVIDNAQKPPQRPKSINTSGGYHDMELLEDGLKAVKNAATQLFDECSKELAKFSIKVDSNNAELVAAHNRVYPTDETPGYITFDEYKYLLTATDSREVQFVKKYYETEMRGPSGTAALDFLIICKAIHAEVGRIRTFITDYIGDLDETAEFRTVELFQDWTQTALSLLSRIKTGIQTPVPKSIPRSEVARLTPELSANFQALLQSRLNVLNKYVTDFVQLFETNWNGPSESFYKSKLGPSLLFQVKVGKNLTDPGAMDPKKYPTLMQEVQGSMKGLAMEYSVALTDQLKRNQSFDTYITGVMNNVDQRETYKNYIRQLSKNGKSIVNNFVPSTSIDQADAIVNALDPLTTPPTPLTSSTSVLPSHDDLADRDKDDAHPQYLLADGGVIKGNILMDTGTTIDGIRPSTHRHTGFDGSPRIHGTDIASGSVTDEVVNPDATTPVPTGLAISNTDDSQATTITVEVTFDVTSTDGIVNYEFEVVKLDGGSVPLA